MVADLEAKVQEVIERMREKGITVDTSGVKWDPKLLERQMAQEEPEPERACWICDGLGHGYVVGWEEVPGKGQVPILSSPCPLEDQGASDPDETF
jgi:hypothetical protein